MHCFWVLVSYNDDTANLAGSSLRTEQPAGKNAEQNPKNMDDLEGFPIFLETPIC